MSHPTPAAAPSQGRPSSQQTTVPSDAPRHASDTRAVPLAAKILYTAFVAVLVPYYWYTYGATNFLYFCDIALFLGLAAVWTERSIFASTAAVGITAVQLLWQIDFVGTLVGTPVVGLTGYMFNPDLSLFARALSFFHFWLPVFLLYLVWRLGYDRRALALWTGIAWAAMLISYAFLPAPGEPLAYANQPYNVNYVYGLGEQAQTWMPPQAWLALMMVALPLLICGPTHLVMKRAFRAPRIESAAGDLPTVAA